MGDGERAKLDRICPNQTRCREFVYDVAPYDVALYKHAQQWFSQTVAQTSALGPST